MNEKYIYETLQNLAKNNEKYAEFNAKIVATQQKVLGVRLPDLRNFAKNLARNINEFSDAKNLLKVVNDEIYEEVLICGLTIFYAQNLSADEKILLTREYLKKVDNWAQIDTFVRSLKKEKFKKKSGENIAEIYEKYWNFALENLHSDKEFFMRYGIMILFSNFLIEDKIREVFDEIRKISVLKSTQNLHKNSTKNIENYYVKMAAAWLYAEAAVNFFELTFGEMNNSKIDIWTRRKALTKMLESYRISSENKRIIREFRDQLSTKKSLEKSIKFDKEAQKNGAKNV